MTVSFAVVNIAWPETVTGHVVYYSYLNSGYRTSGETIFRN